MREEQIEEEAEKVTAKAGDKVREIGTRAMERAEEQLEEQRERIAVRIEEAAENLEHHAENGNGMRREAEHRVALGMGSAAGFLHSHATQDVTRGVGGFVRHHPLRALLIGLATAFLLNRFLR